MKKRSRKARKAAFRSEVRKSLRMESLEDRLLLATAVLDTDGVLEISGDVAADEDNAFVLSLSDDGSNLVVADNNGIVNGAAESVFPFAGVTSIEINGHGGDDWLHVSLDGGLPIPIGGLSVSGGDQVSARGDGMSIEGLAGTSYDMSYLTLPGDASGKSGTVTLSANGVSRSISFAGLEPLSFTGAGGTLTLDASSTPATTTLTLSDTGAAGDGVNIVTGNGGFEDTTFSGFDSLVVRGGDGSETITVASIDSADPDGGGSGAALTDITLDGDNAAGTDTAADTINLQDLPATINATIFGAGGSDTINIGSSANSLGSILGPVVVNGETHAAGTSSLTIAGDTNTLDSGDILNLNDQGDAGSFAYALDATTLARTGVGTVTYGTIETLNLNTSIGAADVNVTTTADGINTNITTQDAADSVDVATTGLDANVIINTAGGADGISLVTTGGDGPDGGSFGSFTQVNAGNDGDTLTQQGSGAASRVEWNGQAGADGVDVQAAGALGVTNVNGDADSDVFDIVPQANSTIHVNGHGPSTPLPADTLNIDVTGLTAELNLIPTSAGFAGRLVAAGVGDVTFVDVETIDPTLGGGTIDVRIRWDLSTDAVLNAAPYNIPGNPGLGDNGGADTTLLSLAPGGANLVFDANAATSVLQLPVADINSVRIDGSGDDDTLTIDDVNGLPSFNSTVPGVTDNPNIAGSSELLFNGAGGADGINFVLDQAGVNPGVIDQIYAMGDGVGGGAGAGTSEGEILTRDNGTAADLQVYFTGLEPLTTSGTPGGLLTVLGDLSANVLDILPSPVPGFTRVAETAGPFEFLDFAANAFTSLEVYGMGGSDRVELSGLNAAEVALTTVRLDGDSNSNSDPSNDVIRVRSTSNLPAATLVSLYGGDGNDTFILDSTGTDGQGDGNVQSILAAIDVSPAGDEGGATDELRIDDFTDPDADTVVITSTTIEGITPGAANPDITYNGSLIETVSIETSNAGADILNIQSTMLGSSYVINTNGGGDIVNVSSDAPANAGTLNDIDGQINLDTGSGVDTLVASDLGDAAGDNYDLIQTGTPTLLRFTDGAAPLDLFYDAKGVPGQLENFKLIGSNTGDNTYNIDDTTATVSNLIEDGDAAAVTPNDAVFTINPGNLQPGATNEFDGFDGNDTFNVMFADGGTIPGAAGTTFVIRGNTNVAGPATDNRDRVNVSTVADTGAPRSLSFAYQSNVSGDVNIEGLSVGPNNTVLNIDTSETIVYSGSGASDDVVTVIGTGADDDLTVAPLAADEALVFLGGNPWDGPAPADPETFFNAVPGIGEEDGTTGPDMRLGGLGSLTVDGGAGTLDHLYVYGQSEDPITAGSGDPLGLGSGVIIPGQGVGGAYDEIMVTDALVRFVDSIQAAVPTDVLLPVGIATASFVQPDELTFGLTVNAGFEATPAGVVTPGFPTETADDVVATLSNNFSMQVNGGDPVQSFAPDGDHLNVVTPAEVNVFSDKSTPPVVSVTSGASPFGVGFSSIEFSLFTPGNGQVNLIGDNNDPNVSQTDNFVVLGQDVNGDGNGQNEFSLRINADTIDPNFPALYFAGVDDLNVFGDDQNPPPGVTDAAVDTLEITPYADDTPRGWGIDVSFDEGDPVGSDGSQADLLILHTSLLGGQTSEDIVVQPAGPDNGQVVVTNRSFGTPIVDIDYVANTDIIVLDDDGFLNDTDTLTLLGTNPDNPQTSGSETFDVDFSAAGTIAAPQVVVTDTGGAMLYRIRTIDSGGLPTFSSVRVGGLAGNDVFNVKPEADVAIQVNGGDPIGQYQGTGDALNVMTGGATFSFQSGTDLNSGAFQVAGMQPVDFDAVERLLVDGVDYVLPDRFESNDSVAAATVLGSLPTITLNELTLDGDDGNGGALGSDTNDQDFYQLVAHETGRLAVTAYFTHADGDINIQLLDSLGNVIVSSTTATDDESLTAPVVAGQTYVLRVFSADSDPNEYSLELDSFPAPVPSVTDLVDSSDTGKSNSDNITADNTPTIEVTADLASFASAGITIDAGAGTPGADVVLTATSQTSGAVTTVDASLVAGASNNLWVGTFGVLADDEYVMEAWVRVEDGAGTPAVGRSPIGDPITVTIDTTAPAAPAGVSLLSSSDTLPLGDDITSINTPAYSGFGEPRTSVRLYANNGAEELAAQGLVTTSGVWELTSTPLDDDVYAITAELEDAAGNISPRSAALPLTVAFEYGFRLDPITGHVVYHGEDGIRDEVTLSLDAGGTNVVIAWAQPSVGTSGTSTFPVASTPGVTIDLHGGDDVLTVDNTNGLVDLPDLITFLGGNDVDTLQLIGSTALDSATYSVGPEVSSGTVTHVAGTASQVITFTGLEPVQDNVVAGTATVNGANSDNAINYSAGAGGGIFVGNSGLVSVDGFETYEFNNKASLLLNGNAGDDVFNLNNATTPTGLTGIAVNGNGPTASDRLIMNAVPNELDRLTVVPASQGAGSIVTSSAAISDVTYSGVEDLTLVGQLADGDNFGVDGTAGDDLFQYFTGATPDSGTVRGTMDAIGAAFTLPSINFSHMSQPSVMRFNQFGNQGGVDAFAYVGADADEAITYDGAGLLTSTVSGFPLAFIDIGTPNSATPGTTTALLIEANDGADAITLTGEVGVQVSVTGGQPDTGSDSLTYLGGGAASLIDLEAQLILETGLGPVAYSLIETINLDAGGVTPTVELTSGDDDLTVTVGDANSGTIERGINVQQLGQVASNPIAPVVNYSNTAGNPVSIDSGAGQDTLIVVGNADAQSIDVDASNAIVSIDDNANGLGNDGIVTYVNAESLTVNGLEGNDAFAVTAGAIPIFIDGGDPIGVTGDRINVTAAGNTTFAPGPESDEGGFSFAGAAPVSYDRIEGLSLDLAGNTLDVNGTNAADQIKVDGTPVGTDIYDVSVNDSPAVRVTNSGALTIDGLHGDDDIDIDVRDLALAALTVRGDNPSVDGDTLTVEGVAGGADDARWQPTVFDGGTLTVGAQTITVRTIEQLMYDGENEAENLTVELPAAGAQNLAAFELNTFTFIGSVEVNSDGGSLLGIEFGNISALGSVTIDGATAGSAADSLAYGGRNEIDQMLVTNGGVITNDPLSIPVLTPGVEDLILLGRGGNDVFDIASDHPYDSIVVTGDDSDAGATADANGDLIVLRGASGADARAETITVTPNPWIDSETYITGTGTNGQRNISTSGVERIYYLGDGDDDMLSIDPGAGTHSVRVDKGRADTAQLGGGQVAQAMDRITTDSLPQIQANGLLTLQIAPGGVGSVEATLVTGDLTQASNYYAVLDANDTLTIEGGDAVSDVYTVINPPAVTTPVAFDGSVQITDGNSGVVVTETSNALGQLRMNTLGGSDILFVDVDAGTGSDLINVPISYNGAGGFDSLVVRGTPSGSTPPEAIYAPGPQVDGGQVIHSGAIDQLIEFTGLEPVLDLVPGPLSVLGTNADNTINYRPGSVDAVNNGVVEVDDFETYEFSNKTTLTINGLAGDDLINLNNPNTPTALTGITVNGNDVTGADVATSDDVLVVHGTLGADTINFTPTAGTEDAGQVTGAQPVTVTFATTESLVIDGEGDTAGTGDALTITSPTGANTITYTPGANVDSGQVLVDNLVPMTFRGLDALGTAGTQGSVSFADAAPARSDTLVHRGSDSDDVFSVAASGDVTLANNPGTHVTASTPGVSHLTLDGLDGTDTFTVNAAHPFTLIQVDGGGSDVGDVLNLDDATGRDATIVADLAASTVAGFGSVAGELVKFDGLEQVYINGTDGTDTLTVNGTTDDDLLTYTPNGPQAGRFYSDGHPSLFIFENIASTFTVDLLTDVGDEVAVEGTRNSDTITVDSPARTVTVENAAGVVLKPVVLANSVETATVLGREGSDTTVVVPAAAVTTGVAGGPAGTLKPINLRVNVDGGDSSPSDSLVIAADATGTPLDNATHFVIVNHSRQEDEGVVRIFRDTAGAGNDPAQLPDISFVDVHHVAPLLQGVTASQQPNLLILGPDMYEENEYLGTAGMLGTGKRLNVENLAIFPNAPEVRFAPADQDWFRVVAEQTGTLDVQAYFQQYDPEVLPGAGDLQLQVYDADGNLISGFGSDESSPTDQDERVRIPAVAGQTYFIRVFGANDTVVNGYDMVVLNDAPPVPYDIELDDFLVNGTPNPPGQTDNSDTGRSHHDNITYDDTPTIRFRLDDAIFLHDIQGNPTNAQNNPPDQNIPIPFNSSTDVNNTTAGFRVPVFIEGTPQEPGQQPQVLVGFAQPVAGVEGVYEFDFANAVVNLSTVTSGLDDGSHFINAKVQIIDPSGTTQRGLGGRSQSLEVVVDTVPPPVFFGLQSQPLDGLHPDSDTGNPLQEETFSDRITSDRTPTFWGLAEADVLVRLYVDMDNNNIVSAGDVFIGESVAVPFDGNNQFGNLTADQPNGQWELTSTVNLNDPNLSFPKDGLRRILVNAEDVAGNISNPQVFEIFLDTQGPRVYDPDGPGGVNAVHITDDPATTRDESLYDLFDPKPSVDGPTPLANSITVNIEDLPIRLPGLPASFLYPALKTPLHVVDHATGLLIDADGGGPLPAGRSPLDVGYFQVRGDSNGIIPIDKIWFDSDVVVSGDRATGVIIIEFPEPLQDDRYTLIVRDDLTDHPGNALDGEMDTVEPQDSATYEFPSGDLLPGGDFLARFTIDTRPEIAVYAAGSVWVDTNGNALFDPTNQDFTNRDITYKLGYTTDDLFVGNFAGPGVDGFWGTADDDAADGFDKLASYGRIGSGFRWLIDYDNDGVPDAPTPLAESTLHINGLPFAGNFDNNPVNGDEVGLFDGETWYFDTDHDFQVDRTYVNPNLSGIPIVGDFDGDGHDDLGTWKDDWFTFELSNGQDKSWLGDNVGDSPVLLNKDFGFIGVREIPVVADMDMDGIDDFGLWVPDRTGVNPDHVSEWYFLVSGEPGHGGIHQGTLDAFNAAFTPIPFSTDMYATFGDEFAAPLVGNFDPPVSASLVQPLQFGNTNIDDAADINGDGLVTAVDVLILINELNDTGSRALGAGPMQGPYLDPTGDNFLAPQDPLVVINRINARVAGASGEAEGEAANVQFVSPTLASPAPNAPSQSESADSFFAQAEGEQSLDAWYTAEEAADTLLAPSSNDASPAGAEVEEALEDILSGI